MGFSSFPSSGIGGGGGGGNPGTVYPSDTIDFRTFGADPTGGNDSTTQIQAYIDAKVAAAGPHGSGNDGYSIILPPGKFKTSATINLAGTGNADKRFALAGSPGGTWINGTVPGGYVLVRNLNATTPGPNVVRDIHFINNSATGLGCVSLGGVIGLQVESCSFSTNSGVLLNLADGIAENNTFQKLISGCNFTANTTVNDPLNTTIGILSKAHTVIVACDMSLLLEGVRLYGSQMSIFGGRFENCKIAINVGVGNSLITNPAGTFPVVAGTDGCQRAKFDTISGESNYVFIACYSSGAMEFSGVSSSGGLNSGIWSGEAAYGLYDKSGATYTACNFSGNYSVAAIASNSYAAQYINTFGSNSKTGTAAWTFLSYQDLLTIPYASQFINCTAQNATDQDAPTTPPFPRLRAVSGTTDTMKDTDSGRLITYKNASPIAVTLPAANVFSLAVQKYFMDGSWTTVVVNEGSGTVTITPQNHHAAVACATTANITLSGEQTIDGITTSASRVLVKNQATASQNGIYKSAAGAWTRPADANTRATLILGNVSVTGGTVNAGTFWKVTNTGNVIIGTTSITYGSDPGPLTSAIDGATSATITTGQGTEIFSDGLNYYTVSR